MAFAAMAVAATIAGDVLKGAVSAARNISAIFRSRPGHRWPEVLAIAWIGSNAKCSKHLLAAADLVA